MKYAIVHQRNENDDKRINYLFRHLQEDFEFLSFHEDPARWMLLRD
jgi:hypothetical protein